MKKIIFDFDGTLLDSSHRHIEVLRDSAEECGCVLPIDEKYLSFKANGKTTIQFLEELGLGKELCDSIAASWINKIERAEYLVHDILYEDTFPILNACKQRGHFLYLLSARAKEQNYYKQVETLALESYFNKVICVSPQNAVEQKCSWIKRIGADIVIGDTEVDYYASKQASVCTYILNRGFRSRKFWEELNVTNTYESLNHLLNII